MKSFSARQTAMLAYIPIVGFLIAFSINREVKSDFATWHIKNMFGLFILFFVAMVFMSTDNPIIGDTIWIIAFLLWIYSFLMVLLNKKQGIPLLGNKIQGWFTFLN